MTSRMPHRLDYAGPARPPRDPWRRIILVVAILIGAMAAYLSRILVVSFVFDLQLPPSKAVVGSVLRIAIPLAAGLLSIWAVMRCGWAVISDEKQTSLAEIPGPGREADEQELDRVVENARNCYHARVEFEKKKQSP